MAKTVKETVGEWGLGMDQHRYGPSLWGRAWAPSHALQK